MSQSWRVGQLNFLVVISEELSADVGKTKWYLWMKCFPYELLNLSNAGWARIGTFFLLFYTHPTPEHFTYLFVPTPVACKQRQSTFFPLHLGSGNTTPGNCANSLSLNAQLGMGNTGIGKFLHNMFSVDYLDGPFWQALLESPGKQWLCQGSHFESSWTLWEMASSPVVLLEDIRTLSFW